jgi:hypothetical protein
MIVSRRLGMEYSARTAAATKLLCMIAPLGGRMDRHKHRPNQILTHDLPVAPEHEVVVVLQYFSRFSR